MRTHDANQLRPSGPLTVAGKSPRKAGLDPTSIQQRARTVQPELGEPRRRHLSQSKPYSAGWIGEKGRQLSISWRVCVLCVPMALTRLTGPASKAIGKLSESQPGMVWPYLCDQQPVRCTRDTNLILPPTKQIVGLPGSASGSNEGVPTNYCRYACGSKKCPDRLLTHK